MATYVYDRLLAKPGLGSTYEAKLQELAEGAAARRREIADHLEERAARQKPLPHPLSAYAGTFENPELGRIEWSVRGKRLEARMGVMWSEAEVYDAAANQLRVELMGGGQVIRFQFEGDRAVRLRYLGRTFTRQGRPASSR